MAKPRRHLRKYGFYTSIIGLLLFGIFNIASAKLIVTDGSTVEYTCGDSLNCPNWVYIYINGIAKYKLPTSSFPTTLPSPLDFNIGASVEAIETVGTNPPQGCQNTPNLIDCLAVNGALSHQRFTVVSGCTSAPCLLRNTPMMSSVSDLGGQLSSSTVNTFYTLMPLIALAVALPLTFYTVLQIQGMFRRSRGRKGGRYLADEKETLRDLNR
jgi:hypothetical protein